MKKELNTLFFKEVDTKELYGDAHFIGAAAVGFGVGLGFTIALT